MSDKSKQRKEKIPFLGPLDHCTFSKDLLSKPLPEVLERLFKRIPPCKPLPPVKLKRVVIPKGETNE